MKKWMESHPLPGLILAVMGILVILALLELALMFFLSILGILITTNQGGIAQNSHRIVLAAQIGTGVFMTLFLAKQAARMLGKLTPRQGNVVDLLGTLAATLTWAGVFFFSK
jgi:hypothetical protein